MRFLVSALAALGLCVPTLAVSNVVGSDLQNFNASTNGIDFVTVQSSETLSPGIINLGLMLNYSVNSLPVYEAEDENQARLEFHDSILSNEFLLGVGLLENFDVGVSLMRLLHQQVEDNDIGHGEFDGQGWMNYRLNAKYRLGAWKGVGFAAIYTTNINTVRRNPYLGKQQGAIHNFEAIADTDLWGAKLAVNAGYRWRDAGEPLENSEIKPTDDQLIGSVAASYLLRRWDVKTIAEIYGSRPTRHAPTFDSSTRQASSLEGLIGAKYDHSTNLAFHAGGGSEFIHGVSSPDWRVYAGVNWTFGPVLKDEPEPAFPDIEPLDPPKQQVIELSEVQFKFDSGELTESSLETLQGLADELQGLDSFHKIVVEGHTDSVGDARYNLELSRKRAGAVRSALIDRFGFSPEKIEAVGYGEQRPIANNGNYQGRRQNRRVEVRVFFEAPDEDR